MRKLVALALAASVLAPVAASAAVSPGELRRDRAEVREEARDYRQALRSGSPRDVREARSEYRDAVDEYREDIQDRRRGYQGAYRAKSSRFDAPFAYSAYRPGAAMGRGHYGQRYLIANPHRWDLPPAYGANQWVRHYDDALLVNMRTGQVRRVIRNVF